MTHKELKFENLFKKALSEWPDEMELQLEDQVLTEVRPSDEGYDLCIYKTVPWDGDREAYVVKNLRKIYNKATDSHLDTEEEVIWIHVHKAITRIIRRLSLFTTHITLKNLRLEPVKQELEAELRRILKDRDWAPQDIELIEQYFAANPSDLKSSK